MIEINTPLVHASIASVLSSIRPDAKIYDNPNQQGTELPAWFIVHREPVRIEREIGRFWLVYGLDIYYMLEYNRPRLFDEYGAVGDALDSALVYLPIFGAEGVKTHVYDREWTLELGALKYSLTLRFHASEKSELPPRMMVIEDLKTYLKHASNHDDDAIITFIDPFSGVSGVEIPAPLWHKKGTPLKLPTIPAKFTMECDGKSNDFKALRWSAGEFGSFSRVNSDMNIILIWEKV